MRKRFLSVAALLPFVLAACNNRQSDLYQAPKASVRIMIREEGECKPYSGSSDEATGLDLIRKTDTIKAELGRAYGASYELISSTAYTSVPIEVVWRFPALMYDSSQEDSVATNSYTKQVTTNEVTYSKWTFEEERELVRGRWQLCLYYKHHLLYRKNFFVL